MSNLQRQNTLFTSEAWIRIYDAIQNVDFRAFDSDTLVAAILDHLRNTFESEFDDWIASSEFIMKVEVLAWLSQNIAYRTDLNTRENFLATAERRDSLIRLAQNISYKISRVRGAAGRLRIESIRTNQSLFDSNNIALQDREISWGDPRNEDFFEQFVLIMNAAFTNRTQFGRALAKFVNGENKTEQYVFNGQAPSNGGFPFVATINGVGLPFEVINSRLDKKTGQFVEFPPNPENAFNVFYETDGLGLSSNGTGFFYQFRQGSLQFQDETFTELESVKVIDIGVQNINNDDFFVQELDTDGSILSVWEKVDTVFGESVSFNVPTTGDARNVYEIDSLENDKVRIRFGDGKFGKIPVGRFRFWYRISNPEPEIINISDIGRQSFTLPYVSEGTVYLLTMTLGLKASINNASASESNFNIRTRANQVFYSQNRMVTGRDYNGFFLKDTAISKVKTINRTFSGHSRFAKIHDPTGLYENLKIAAEDGRFFQERVRNVGFVTADTSVLRNSLLIQNNISPLLSKANKSQLYFNDYPEQFFGIIYYWFEDSVVAGQSRGRFVTTKGNSGTAVDVGATGVGNLTFVATDSVLRLVNPRGSNIRVDRVIGTGNLVDGVILETSIPTGTVLVAVFPPFRSLLLESERIDIEVQLDLKLDFGLTWNQATQKWNIITFSNLDKQEPSGIFCLDFQGDSTDTNKDQSWLLYLEFTPGGIEEDKWKIVDRGVGIFFESAKENDFFFASNEAVLDPDTGKIEHDRVVILECNESRDSLRRRGLNNPSILNLLNCDIFCYEFVGDGTMVKFSTQESPLSDDAAVTVDGVLQLLGIDYTKSVKVSGDGIIFSVAPILGSEVLICISRTGGLKVSSPTIFTGLGDNVNTTFDLGIPNVSAFNMLLFLDGILQRPLSDYTMGVAVNGNATVIFPSVLSLNVNIVGYMLGGISNSTLAHLEFVGNGIDAAYVFTTPGSQNDDTILVAIDGVVQDITTYGIGTVSNVTTITFTITPTNGAKIRFTVPTDPSNIRTQMYNFGTTDGIVNTFILNNQSISTGESSFVFLDGVLQDGPWSISPVWTTNGINNIFFATPPTAGQNLTVFVILGAIGNSSVITNPVANTGTNNLGDISTSSLLVQYLGKDIPLFVEDAIRHADGYINENGLEVKPADIDNSGFVDSPFIFKDIVLQDGFTDLVLWQAINEFGFTVFEPINAQTNPRGTYGLSTQGDIAVNDATTKLPETISSNNGTIVLNGDIHYDISTDKWLVANSTTVLWELAADQTLFKHAIGRDHLKFLWLHFAPDAFRIDPSVSNVMDSYILTTTYDEALRTALSNNTPTVDLPLAPTPESLRLDFASFDDFKTNSDSIIYHSARYKILFGIQAVIEVQATFKIIQSEGSLLSDNDLKLRILEIIDTFFAVGNFDFGETLYLTELLAFIHQEISPNIQSIVAVPVDTTQSFGRLFQIRSEPDELFISAASAENIELVSSFTDDELRIGTIS